MASKKMEVMTLNLSIDLKWMTIAGQLAQATFHFFQQSLFLAFSLYYSHYFQLFLFMMAKLRNQIFKNIFSDCFKIEFNEYSNQASTVFTFHFMK